MISFDDAVNNNNIDIYSKLFKEGRNNPNGCAIKSTFFISHKYTNYSAVQELHRKGLWTDLVCWTWQLISLRLSNILTGHEIAAHSITHNSNEKYWSEASVEQWAKEMAGVGRLY